MNNKYLEKIAVSTELVNKVLSSQASSGRLAQFSNKSMTGAARMMAKTKKYQAEGKVDQLRKTLDIGNKRISTAGTSANLSMQKALK